jgi:hypothetical protein
MLWALLAAFLTRRPPWVQAGMVGLCTGLFVVGNVNAGPMNLHLGYAVTVVVTVAAISGGAFLSAQLRRRAANRTPPVWVLTTYVAVWLVALAAAVGTLFGDAGVRVAVVAIVPIVLLTPSAFDGVRALLGRRPDPDPAIDAVTEAGGPR